MKVFAILLAVSILPTAEKHQVTGLFAPEREADLHALFETIPEIKLIAIDFSTATATFDYVPAKVFPGAKPDQVVQRFDNMVRQASRGTFGIKAMQTVPQEKLKLVEIPVAGCICKACSLGAYEAIYKLDGVERATASFKAGLVTAWIDPAKIDRAALEAALKKKQVTIREK